MDGSSNDVRGWSEFRSGGGLECEQCFVEKYFSNRLVCCSKFLCRDCLCDWEVKAQATGKCGCCGSALGSPR